MTERYKLVTPQKAAEYLRKEAAYMRAHNQPNHYRKITMDRDSKITDLLALLLILVMTICAVGLAVSLDTAANRERELRATVCELALSAAPTPSDTLGVYTTYNYCFDLEQKKSQYD